MKTLLLAVLAVGVAYAQVDWSQIKNKPDIAALDYAFASQIPGTNLVASSPATITLIPCPKGLRAATDTGHYLYVSGTGTPESVLVTGGTCNGSGNGTVQFTPAGNHSGLWSISSATGGIQEAICSLPTSGGTVSVRANLTLRANVAACGKTSVVVAKDAGVALTGSFTILGKNSSSTYVERFGSDFALSIPGGSFSYGAIVPQTGYKFHVEGGQIQPTYPAFDPVVVIGRADTSNPGGAGYARTALSIYHQVDYVAGTPWGMISILDQSTIDSAQTGGTAAVLGRVVKHTSSNGWTTGVHGEVFADGAGTSIGINSEVTKTAAGPGALIGIVSQLTNASIDTQHTGIAYEGIVNYPNGGINPGGGFYLLNSSGESTYGFKLEENGGTFDNPFQVITKQAANPQIQIISASAGTAQSAARVGFFRDSLHQVGEIRGDIVANDNFSEGEVSIWTRNSDSFFKIVTFNNVGGLTFSRPIHAANLAGSGLGNGSIIYCDDCTSVCGGAGTGAFAKKVNGSWVCN